MAETLYAPDPTVLDEHMTDRHVADQIAMMEQREADITPVEAYEVGRVAVAPMAELAEIGARPPEAHAREFAGILWRVHTPYGQENAAAYGGEAERQHALDTVRGIADQSRLTNRYFDGRHKRLGRQLEAGEISQDEHDQAVGEILTGLALTNPQKLRQVGEAQRSVIERRAKAGVLPEDARFVDVTSRLGEGGKVELAGIDKVVAQMTRATSYAEFSQQGLDLKGEFYTPENLARARERHERQQAELRALEAAAFEAQMRRTIDMLDEDAKKKKKTKK